MLAELPAHEKEVLFSVEMLPQTASCVAEPEPPVSTTAVVLLFLIVISGFWGQSHQTSLGALPLGPIAGFPFPDPFLCLSLSKMLAMPVI